MDENFLINTYEKLLVNYEKSQGIIAVNSRNAVVDNTLPISVEIHLSNRCNLNCEWCVDREIRQSKKELSRDVLYKVINEFAHKGIGLTIEGGGEPTVHPFFEEFVFECKKSGIKLGLITNGVKKISVEVIKKFDWIRVSVDSANADEYAREKGCDCFKKVIENVKYISRNAPNVVLSIGFVLTNRNWTNLENLFLNLKDANIDHYRFRTVEENESLCPDEKTISIVNEKLNCLSEKYKVKIIKSLVSDVDERNNKGLPCVAHSLRAIIHADGNVLLCEKRRHDIIILGNIYENDFNEIWYSEKRKEITEKLLCKENQRGCEICLHYKV